MLIQLSDSAKIPSVSVLALDRTKGFTHFDRKELRAYWLTGLSHRALVSPNSYVSTNPLLTRQAFYIKSSLAVGLTAYIDSYPVATSGLSGAEYYKTVAYTDDLEWEANSYLFELSKYVNSREKQHTLLPRFVINQANNIPYHGDMVVDDCRIIATPQASASIDLIHTEHSAKLQELLTRINPSQIDIANYAQTTLNDEICTHEDFTSETNDIFLKALVENDQNLIASSLLLGGVEVINCPRLYHPVLLSFYLSGVRSYGVNTDGARMGEFKNYYNVLEFYMSLDGVKELERVILKKVGKGNLRRILLQLKRDSVKDSVLSWPFHNDEDFFGKALPKIIPSSSGVLHDIAGRLYTKRNAIMHSKKMRNGLSSVSIHPSRKEVQIEFEVTLLRLFAEHIITNAKVTD